jgi:hypothetical protein
MKLPLGLSEPGGVPVGAFWHEIIDENPVATQKICNPPTLASDGFRGSRNKQDTEYGATSATKTGPKGGGYRRAGIDGLALRFALNAAPFGLRRPSLRARPSMNKQQNRNAKKGTLLSR